MSTTTFADLGLPEPILKALADCGYTTPTPIQEQAIPVLLAGRDLVGAAQTGTGKTAAFALPTLAQLGTAQGTLPRCLVLTPTRELAMQVEENFRKYGTTAGLRIALIYGGVGFGLQIEALRNGVDVVVATPGRLLDLWDQGLFKPEAIKHLILDEVDRMLDMGFIEDVTRIINRCPKDRQTLLFSATADESIARIAKWALKDPVRVDVRTGTGAADTVDHCIYPVDSFQKYDLLMALLRKLAFKSVIVFTRTKRDADRITEWVASGGHAVATMHADRSQTERFEALQGFKSGKYPVLVATDVAARGLDVRGVTHVINYNVPDHAEDYVHRIGRTGRANTEGEAVTLYSPDEMHHLKAIEQLIGRSIERRKLDTFKYRFEPDLALSKSASAATALAGRRRNR